MHAQQSATPQRASDARVGCVVVACAAVLGAPLGWLWQGLAPRTLAYVNADGYVIPQESESQIAADGRALFLCAGLGLILGVGLWLWRARRGPLMALAAVIAASGAALVMDLSGRLISGGTSRGVAGEVFTLPVEVQARAVLVAAPLFALLGYCVGALFISGDDLGRTESQPESQRQAQRRAISPQTDDLPWPPSDAPPSPRQGAASHGAGSQDAPS